MKLQPLGDVTIVKREKPKEETQYGILLPDVAQEKPQRGVVVAVGPGTLSDKGDYYEPIGVRPGDTVLLTRWGSDEIEFEGEKFLFVRPKDILAVVQNP